MRAYISSFHVSMPPHSITTGGRSTPGGREDVERACPSPAPTVERDGDALDGRVVQARRDEEEAPARASYCRSFAGWFGTG